MTMFSLRLLSCLLVLLSLTSTAVAAERNLALDPEVIAFAEEMQSRHGLEATQLLGDFARTHPNPRVLELIKPPETPQQRSWERYRLRFLNERRIEGGVRFWRENARQLTRAADEFGVPEAVIVAIIGVETEYGRNKGGFGVFEALATLAFRYPPRANFFRYELEQFLLLSRENAMNPLAIKGSYAGAMGIPQFMPGSQRRFAVDYDGDGKINLISSVDDAIGSVASFLLQHGWKAGEAVVYPASATAEIAAPLSQQGLQPAFSVGELRQRGVNTPAPDHLKAVFIDLATPGRDSEYWLGLNNFYVITRYNRSSYYAMSVWQLAEAIRERLCEQTSATATNPAKYCRA